jgi:hypothetical protein
VEYTIFLAEGVNGCSYCYLGATTRIIDIGNSYKGSGLAWLEHLKECKSHIFYIVHKTKRHKKHQKVAKKLSRELNIVKDKTFLNKQKESGVPKHTYRVGYLEPEVKRMWLRKKDSEMHQGRSVNELYARCNKEIRISLEDCTEVYDGEMDIINTIDNFNIAIEILETTVYPLYLYFRFCEELEQQKIADIFNIYKIYEMNDRRFNPLTGRAITKFTRQSLSLREVTEMKRLRKLYESSNK